MKIRTLGIMLVVMSLMVVTSASLAVADDYEYIGEDFDDWASPFNWNNLTQGGSGIGFPGGGGGEDGDVAYIYTGLAVFHEMAEEFVPLEMLDVDGGGLEIYGGDLSIETWYQNNSYVRNGGWVDQSGGNLTTNYVLSIVDGGTYLISDGKLHADEIDLSDGELNIEGGVVEVSNGINADYGTSIIDIAGGI